MVAPLVRLRKKRQVFSRPRHLRACPPGDRADVGERLPCMRGRPFFKHPIGSCRYCIGGLELNIGAIRGCRENIWRRKLFRPAEPLFVRVIIINARRRRPCCKRSAHNVSSGRLNSRVACRVMGNVRSSFHATVIFYFAICAPCGSRRIKFILPAPPQATDCRTRANPAPGRC